MESIEALTDALEDFQGSLIMATHSELILSRISFTKLIICHADGKQQLFLGDYADFLEKAGWEEEKDNKTPPQAPKSQNHLKEHKEHQAKIKAYENLIAAKEKQISKLQEKLLLFPPNAAEIQLSYINLAKEQKACEKLYEQLELLLREKEL